MITDKETNFVYFSSLIKEHEQYAPFWEEMKRVLVKTKTGYGFIQKTRLQNRRRKHNGVTDSFTEMKVFCSPFLSDIGLAE